MKEFIEKLISRLEEETKLYVDDDGNMGFAIPKNKAISIVNQLAEEYGDGWIPSDEPPKTEDYILLSFENFPVPLVGRYEEDEEGGAFYVGDDTESCVSSGIIVNAWQPLPPKYEPKGE